METGGSRMKIILYTKRLIEVLWKEEEKSISDAGERLCLRCGKPLHKEIALNSYSRYADVYICSECGMDEALRDYQGNILPYEQWHAVVAGKMADVGINNNLFLRTDCTFPEVFAYKKREENSVIEYPISEVVYCRLYYNGHRWYNTWFERQSKPVQELVSEIDKFQKALYETAEFKNLNSMERMCRLLKPIDDFSNEFNLYSETQHFYIWIRLITRRNDYNLYVHYYQK